MRLLLHPHCTIIPSSLSRLFFAARLSPSAAIFRCFSQPPAMASSDASTACFSEIDGSIERKEEKLWGGRFEDTVTDAVERFTESISFDKQLYKHDIMGSKAHAAMLAHQAAVGGELAEGVVVMKTVALVTAVLNWGIFLGTATTATGGMEAAAAVE